jgi:uncharacterized protein YcbX
MILLVGGDSTTTIEKHKMRLTEIWIYPVKSLGGIRLASAKVTQRGLQYDRRWMVVDENGVFLTQRRFPKMALIDVSFTPEGFMLSQRMTGSRVIIPFQPVRSQPLHVKIWSDTLTADTVSTEADNWLTHTLGKPVRIVEMRESSHRSMDSHNASQNERVSFVDDFPYHAVGQASLDDLNSRLVTPVGIERFRPNFVFGNTMPFAEDHWKRICIGNIAFELASPWERCMITTIDPSTAEKTSEPLRTLSTYRKNDKKIYFGHNLINLGEGVINEGDVVQVIL